MAWVFNPFTGTFDFTNTGGITTLTANTTPTTGFTAGQYMFSDGTVLKAGTFGTGVSTALGNAVNATGGLITFATFAPASGKTLTVSHTLTLAGTDGTTMTFPSTSATLARTDAGNTFTSNQTFTGSIVLNGATSGTVTLGVPAAAGTTTFTLPGSNGSANYALTTNGSGVTSWSQISLTAGITGTLPVTNGGTGTSTAFTTGSIVFAGASGVYSQNNTKLFWDNTNSRLGVGFGSPAYTFDIIGADLGATAGNTSLLGRYFSQTGNGESLQILYSRTASSPTNWTTANLILRREVSGTIQQALQFNGDASTTINHSTNELLRITSSGNVGIRSSTFGTSAVGVLSIATGTAPTTGPADTIQIYSTDLSAGNTIPSIYCEGTGVTTTPITNTTVTNKIAVRVNGTVYYLLATTNAT